MSENTAQTEKPEKPINVVDLYKQLEAEGLAKPVAGKGEKAEKIRALVRDVAKKVGKPKVMMSALYKIAKNQYPDEKIDRSYFASTLSRTWETEKDEGGHVWILVSKEKKPATKDE